MTTTTELMSAAPLDGTTIIATDTQFDEWRAFYGRGAWRIDTGARWARSWVEPRLTATLISWRPA